LPESERLIVPNDLFCVEWDVKPYQHTTHAAAFPTLGVKVPRTYIYSIPEFRYDIW